MSWVLVAPSLVISKFSLYWVCLGVCSSNVCSRFVSVWRFLLNCSHSYSRSLNWAFPDWFKVEATSALFFAKAYSIVSSVLPNVSFSDSLFVFPPPFWDCHSECSYSWVDFSWVSSWEFSLELPSRLMLGVGSLIGSICSRSNGTFVSLLFLYT